MKQNSFPTMRDVWAARKTIGPSVFRTPLVLSALLSESLGAGIYLKLETYQEIGAFKVRGAANKILNLTAEEKKRGVITFSTGNHGIAVSYIAGRQHIPAVVCLSQCVPEAKVNMLRRLGAAVRQVGYNQDDAEACCYQVAKDEKMTIIKPFDDPYVISGQGTIGLEIIEDCPDIDTAIIPVSGGGLFSGVAMVLKSYNPKIRIIGVSMEKSAVMYRSIEAGHPVILEEEPTLADSLLGGIGEDNQYTFEMVKKYIDDFVLVSEEEIAQAMAYLFAHHRLVVEGAAAVGIAAALPKRGLIKPGSNAAIVVTGKNVCVQSFMETVQKHLKLDFLDNCSK